MDNIISIPEHQESIFEKILDPLNDYYMCKLRMQQWAFRGHLTSGMAARGEKQLEGYKNRIKEILEIEK